MPSASSAIAWRAEARHLAASEPSHRSLQAARDLRATMAVMTSLRLALVVSLSLVACSNGSSGTDAATDGPSSSSRTERYIRGDVATRLVVEVDYVSGALPRAAAETELSTRLGSLLDKPGGVQIVHGDAIPSHGADHAWTFAELTALGTQTFTDDTTPGTIVMHVMWIDGHDANDTSSARVLGVSWDNLHTALYHDSVEAQCAGMTLLGDRACSEMQYGVWLHEIGHTIGLVDNGTPMASPHEDATHLAHDSSSSCIMYWAYDGSAGGDMITSALLGGGSAPDFDANCLADIAAIRNR